MSRTSADTLVGRAERVVDAFFVLAWGFQVMVLAQLLGQQVMPQWRLVVLGALLVGVGAYWLVMRLTPRGRPDAVVVLASIALAYTSFGDSLWPLPLVLVVMIPLAVARGMRWAIAFAAVFVMVATLTMAVAYRQPWGYTLLQVVVLLVILSVVLTIVALVLRVDRGLRENARLLDELEQAHSDLAASVETEKELAVSQARTRSARDLHDGLGHRLAVSGYSLEFALRMRERDPEAAWEQVAQARGTVTDAMRELRSWVRALAPGDEVDPADPLGLIQRSFAGSGLDVTVSGGARPRAPLPAATAEIIHRAAQEGVTNAIKHAPGAPIRLTLLEGDDDVTVEVVDGGPGAPADAAEGFGLRNLRERVERSGGVLTTVTGPATGYRLIVTLPRSQEGR